MFFAQTARSRRMIIEMDRIGKKTFLKILCSTLPSHCSIFWRDGFIQITTFGQQKTTFSRIYVGTVDFCMRKVEQKQLFRAFM